MKKYIFENFDKTWWAEYQVDGMQTTDSQKILSIRSKSVSGTINNTDIDSAMVTLGLPVHYGTSFTEVDWIALAIAKNLSLTMYYENAAGVVKQVAYNTAKEILTFSFLDSTNTALSADAVGTINAVAKTIAVTVPALSVVTALKASFTLSSGAYATVGSSVDQVSGTTANNFTSPVVYKIHSSYPDLVTKDWTITVTIAS